VASITNPSTLHEEGKLTYIKLNNQMPCPPRGTVPVNQGWFGAFFQLTISGSLSVMVATVPAMSDSSLPKHGVFCQSGSAPLYPLSDKKEKK
jgi:hypothetical protein